MSKAENKLYIASPLPMVDDEDELERLIDIAIDWALMHGMCMRSKVNFDRDSLQFSPFILMPSPFPRKEFENACQIQTILNELIFKVAHDHDFLKETLEETIKVDSFTRNLFNIYETVYEEGFTQNITLGLLRSDLMLDTSCPTKCSDKNQTPYCCWKQVEINTIASGFGWLGPASTQLHKFILRELGYDSKLKNLPDNDALKGLCKSMIDAWTLYGNTQAVILFLIEDKTYNICDQRFHEFEITRQHPKVRVIRRTLTQLAATAKLGPNNELLVNDLTVALVYFRSGYEPAQYHSEKEWNVRLLIERSLAIKCPAIQYHLAGTKKVQQGLAKPNVVNKFLKNESSVLKVEEIFTGLYALNFDAHGDTAIEMAIKNPERYVLKPQREGGCNNVYGTEIKDFLETVKERQERVAWILMDRINPPVHRNYMIRPGSKTHLEQKDLVSELGIFGAIIANGNVVLSNRQCGHMLRTKISTANEGGVATGLGACDSPFLID